MQKGMRTKQNILPENVYQKKNDIISSDYLCMILVKKNKNI
jgi:hypothetical protein